MLSTLKILIELRRGKRIYKKALTVRFGFDVQRTSQLHQYVKNKATGTLYGMFYLGEKKKAIKLMNLILEKEKDYYDAACLFSLMG